jgi:hypothetical protein
MATHAKVTSLDALETFRAALIVFMTKAHRSLDEVGDEIRRTRQWIENDRRLHWEGEIRRRRRALEQAEQELFSARLSKFLEASRRQLAVRKAKEAVAEAEEKLRAVKLWNQKYDAAADPMAKGLEGLRHFIERQMPGAVSFLVQAQKILEAYTTPAVPDGGGETAGRATTPQS